MSTTKEPFTKVIPCPVAGKEVTVIGMRVRQYGGQGPYPINIAEAHTSCDGTPACGRGFKQIGCPFFGQN